MNLPAARQPSDLVTKMDYAKALAHSNLLPRQYQQQPANLLFALEYADALGVSPINAITSIHVIEGKPSASADLIAAMIRRAGHKLRVAGDDRAAVAVLIRADDPTFEYRAEWTIDKARAAGLVGKSVWKQYPAAMLRSRAITEVARMGASDALFGVVYTPEELGATVDAHGAPLNPEPVKAAPRRVTAADLTAAAPPSGLDEFAPTTTTNPPRDLLSDAQHRALMAALGKLEVKDRDERLRVLSRITGRDIGTSKDLSRDEARVALDMLADPTPEQLAAWIVPPPDTDALPLDGAE